MFSNVADKMRNRKPSDYFSFPDIAEQNSWLDALRAIAILLVLFRHGVRIYQSDDPDLGWLQNLFLNGWVGVDLFLVLSGYLIAGSIARASKENGFLNVGRYFSSRVLRIVPAYFVVLGLVVLGAFPFYTPPGEISLKTVFYHLLFLQDYLPSNINVVFWSLGVEEKFYILAPLLMLGLAKFKNRSLALLCLFALFLISPTCKWLTLSALGGTTSYETFFPVLRSPFHLSLEPLIMGVSINFIERRKLLNLSPKTAQMWFIALLSSGALWLSSHEFLGRIDGWDVTAQPILLSFIFGGLVLSASQMNHIGLPFEAGFRVIARLSYSLYLVHFPLIPLATVLSSTTAMPQAVFWVYYFTLSFVAAAALHFGVEKPFLAMKKHIPGPAS